MSKSMTFSVKYELSEIVWLLKFWISGLICLNSVQNLLFHWLEEYILKFIFKSLFHASRDDDDINDVASMAGVNLSEESARILATNEAFVGTQLRSCEDEKFLHKTPLQHCMSKICEFNDSPWLHKIVIMIIVYFQSLKKKKYWEEWIMNFPLSCK